MFVKSPKPHAARPPKDADIAGGHTGFDNEGGTMRKPARRLRERVGAIASAINPTSSARRWLRHKKKRDYVLALGIISLLGLLLRLQHVSVLFYSPISDMVNYLRIADGPFGPTSDEMFLFPPGYGMFLALVREVFGLQTIKPALYVQAFVDTGTLLFLAATARTLFGSRAALCTAFLYAIYYAAVMHSGLLLSETMALFTTSAFVFGMVQYMRRPRVRTLAWLAFPIAYGILVKTNLAPLLVVMVGYAVFAARSIPRSRNVVRLALFVVVTVLLVLPWPIRNWRVTGQKPFISTNFGMNFLQGNNEYATGRYISFDTISKAQQSILQGTDTWTYNDRATAMGKEFIRTHVAYELLWLIPEKLRVLFLEPYPNSNYPWDDGHSGHFGTHPFGPYLKFPLIEHSLLLPLWVLGLACRGRRFQLVPVLTLASLLVPLLVFHTTQRLRFPAEGMMVILASVPLTTVWMHTRFLSNRLLMSAGIVCVVIISLAHTLSVSGPNKLSSDAVVKREGILDEMIGSGFKQESIGKDAPRLVCELKVRPGSEPFLLFQFEYRIETTRIGDRERFGVSPNFKLTYISREGTEVKQPLSPPTILPYNVQLSSRQDRWGRAWRVVRIPAATDILRIEYLNTLPGTIAIRNLSARGAIW